MTSLFIGRTKYIQQLVSFVSSKSNQDLYPIQFVLVNGEAGIGKSYIIKHFFNSIDKMQPSSSSILVGKGICDPKIGKGLSFLPFYQALNDIRLQKIALSSLTSTDYINQIIKKEAPLWYRMLSDIDIREDIDNTHQFTQNDRSIPPNQETDLKIYYQYSMLLNKLAQNNSIILFLDNFQWADIESVRLLSFLAQHTPASAYPISLICAYRSEEVEFSEDSYLRTCLFAVQKNSQCMNIHLRPFTLNDVINYVSELYNFKDKQDPQILSFCETLTKQTSGNPLFLTELLKNFEERGDIALSIKGWQLPRGGFDELPSTLNTVLEERISRLEERLKSLLTVASIEGENFTAQVIARVKNLELSEVLQLLVTQLSNRYELILEGEEKEIAYHRYASLYAFRHGLISDFLYNRLSSNQKRILHQQVGDSLEHLYGPNNNHQIAPQLARHYQLAKDHLKVIYYGKIAAHQEFQKYAVHQSVFWCEVVIDTFLNYPEVAPQLLDFTIEEPLSEGNKLAKMRKQLVDYFSIEELRTLCFDLNVDFENLRGDTKEDKAREILTYFKKHRRSAELVKHLTSLRPNVFWPMPYNEENTSPSTFPPLSPKPIELLRNNTQLLDIMLLKINAHVHLAENDKALEEINRMKSYLDESTKPYYIGQMSFWLGEVLTRKGHFSEATKALKRALSIFKETKESKGAVWALRRLGHINAVAGRFKLAYTQWKQAIKLAQVSNDAECEAMIWTEIAEFAIDEGNLAFSHSASQRALNLFEKINSKKGIGITLRNMGFADYIRGDMTQSEALFKQSKDIFRTIEDGQNYIWSSHHFANCLIGRKAFTQAKEVLDEILPLTIEMNEVGFLPEIYLSLSQIALNNNEFIKATDYVEKAITIVADDDQYTWPRTRCMMGTILIQQNLFVEAESWILSAVNKAESSNYKFIKASMYLEYMKLLVALDRLEEISYYLESSKKAFQEIGAQPKLNELRVIEDNLNIK